MVSQAGGVLAGHRLVRALEDGRLFTPSTWIKEGIRSAAYDLRMSSDRMILPFHDGQNSTTVYAAGEHRTTEVILAPGDTALLSTMERAQFGWDITAVVFAKFRLSARGILVLSGGVVDRGYGLEEDESEPGARH